ncbi:Protein of unknown function, partial [Gryllus bimaculatus]
DSTTTFTTDPPADSTTREPVYQSIIPSQYDTRCPWVHLNLSLPCGDFLQCEDDGSCSENKICCRNECGRMECVFEIKGTRPPLLKEEEVSEPESESEIPEDQPPPMLILPFLAAGGLGSCCTNPRGPSRCEDTCIPWFPICPKAQKCMLNDCGVWECTDTTNEEGLAEVEKELVTPIPENLYDEIPEPQVDEESPVDSRTPTTEWSPLCPKPDLRGGEPCRDACNPRGEPCPGGRVCCPNKCGYGECTDAVVGEQPARTEKEKLFWDLYAENTIHQFEKNVVS